MRAARSNKAGWTQRLAADLRRHKGKTSVLGVLALLAVILGIRLVVKYSGPRGARGSPSPACGLPRAAPRGVDDGAAGGADHWRQGDEATRPSRREEYLTRMERKIDRDLFRPDPNHFLLRPGHAEVTLPAGPSEPGWFGHLAQYVVQKQRARAAYHALVRDIRTRAQKLSLTSTMLGSTPAAVINGKVLHVGDVIDGYRLTRIGSATCRLDKAGVRVELRMTN